MLGKLDFLKKKILKVRLEKVRNDIYFKMEMLERKSVKATFIKNQRIDPLVSTILDIIWMGGMEGFF
jgi:hypothetical protein